MKKTCLWCLPGAFFLLCTLLNLIGCIWSPVLKETVKPALLPLLALTTLAYLAPRFEAADSRKVFLLLAAQLFGFAGDTLLIHSGFPLFAGGMAAFLAGHVFYLCLFGGESWQGLKGWHWLLAGVVSGAIVAALVKAIGINGVMLAPMSIYALTLMLLIFSGLMGVVRLSGATWWIILAGGLLFTFSDAQIAMQTFDVLPFTLRGFVIMLTYLAAQVLLAIGGIRLILKKG